MMPLLLGSQSNAQGVAMQNAKTMRACIWTASAAFTSAIAVVLIGTLALLEEGQTIALRTRSTVAAMQLASTCKISLAGPI